MISQKITKILVLGGLLSFGFGSYAGIGGISGCEPGAEAEKVDEAGFCEGLRAQDKTEVQKDTIRVLAEDAAATDFGQAKEVTAHQLMQDPTTTCRIRQYQEFCKHADGVSEKWQKFLINDYLSRRPPVARQPLARATEPLEAQGPCNCSADDQRYQDEIRKLKDQMHDIEARARDDKEAAKLADLQKQLDAANARAAANQPRPDRMKEILDNPDVQLGELLGKLGLSPGQNPFGQQPFGGGFPGQNMFGQPFGQNPYQQGLPYFAQQPNYLRPAGGLGFGMNFGGNLPQVYRPQSPIFNGSFGAGLGGYGVGGGAITPAIPTGGGFGGVGGGGVVPPATAPYIH